MKCWRKSGNRENPWGAPICTGCRWDITGTVSFLAAIGWKLDRA